MTRPQILFLHGWGFDAGIWRALIALLPEFAPILWDRGYFGPVQRPEVRPMLAIGHSLGAMLLAAEMPAAVPLVAINGFDHFTGPDAISPRVLGAMRRKFSQTPAEVLADFRTRCGDGHMPANIMADRLGADLELLATMDSRNAPARPLCVLHGALDPILPPLMREAVFPTAPRLVHPAAGHLLPQTHPLWCAGHIRAIWQKICR